ncbi:MAG: class I SAM-dependent methyltransferase [Deltaproteobacteria bacterium]|nr:class I SAM-dependent methyltransferase [Deltaproteobacteria bacterium]
MQRSPAEFNQLAMEVLSPLYPEVAEQIVYHIGITTGSCLDLGCGVGSLGLALARITQLEVILYDKSARMLEFAQQYIRDNSLEFRVKTLEGDVHSIPLPDGTMDLAISRSSLFFWKDPVQAFREIYRVLAPGGMSFIGGGFGNREIFREIDKKMVLKEPEWEKEYRKMVTKEKVSEYEDNLEQAGISDYEVIHDAVNFWIMIKKVD